MAGNLISTRRPSMGLYPNSDITLVLNSSKRCAASFLTNGIFSQFSQLISWTDFFFKISWQEL